MKYKSESSSRSKTLVLVWVLCASGQCSNPFYEEGRGQIGGVSPFPTRRGPPSIVDVGSIQKYVLLDSKLIYISGDSSLLRVWDSTFLPHTEVR